MDLLEGFRTALESLLANKLRAALTMLGIIIGVAAVIILLALGNGVSASIQGQIQGIGSNLITIMTDYDNSGGYPALSMKDVEIIQDPLYVPAVKQATAEVRSTQEVLNGGNNTRVTVSGVTASYFGIRNLTVESGQFLGEEDVDGEARVAVLGASAARDLFPDGGFPIGQSVRIRGVQYKVIGVLQSEGGMGFGGPDDQVFIPLTTAQSRLSSLRTHTGQRAVTVVYAEALDRSYMEIAPEQIKEALRELHGIAYQQEDDFSILSQTDILAAFGTIMTTINIFLGAIAGISLLVGGIGIMNIMLVSVTERTREIGIRKAVGALKRDILVQFLVESTLLSGTGGLVGVGIGFVVSFLVGRFVAELTPVIQVGNVLMSSGFALAVGLVFGIYPAWRAASLRPIEALRYE
jgi:putative ABC transport system permease protein